jgi:peptidoglycan-associated lipoprotein
MRFTRPLALSFAGALLASLAAGCASPATVVKPETEVRDAVAAAPMAAPAPTAEAGPTEPACSVSRVHFAFDSVQLDAGARAELKGTAACLVQRRPAAVVIEGHADERGTTEYNMALGSRRADTVRAYLKDLGVGAVLTTISFGKELPLVGGSGEEAWRQNRRAELRLPGDKRSDGFKVAN